MSWRTSWSILLVACAATLLGFGTTERASAAQCAAFAEVDEFSDLFTSVSPSPNGPFVNGTAPLAVAVTLREGILVIPDEAITTSWDWGDGSPAEGLRKEDCSDEPDSAYFPQQTLRHTYAAAGMYFVRWNFSVLGILISPVMFIVQVEAQTAPTATPIPPTATPVPPTATTVPATATPAGPTSTPVPATATSLPGTPTPLPASPTSPPGASPSAQASVAPGATPPGSPGVQTQGPTVPAGAGQVQPTVVGGTPPVSPSAEETKAERTRRAEEAGLYAEPGEYRSEFAASLPGIGDISTDAAVIVTNIVLAGITIWVLFSSVFLNQVLQDRRAELDAATARFTRPLRRLAHGASKGRGVVTAGWVLLITALVYGFLDPGFGVNKASAVLVVAIIAGVGLVTYVGSGTEAAATRRFAGAVARVRPFPATIAVAIGSVALSRAVDLQPGVIYGFVASCAVTGAVSIDAARRGRVTLMAVTAALALTLVCWVSVGWLRSVNEDGGNASLALIEAICVTVFVGGVEGLFFNMIPLSVMDGGKLFRWNKAVWATFAATATFLFWHALLNQQRSNFDALRQASSVTVLVVFLMYSGASVGLWWWFKRRDARMAVA